MNLLIVVWQHYWFILDFLTSDYYISPAYSTARSDIEQKYQNICLDFDRYRLDCIAD